MSKNSRALSESQHELKDRFTSKIHKIAFIEQNTLLQSIFVGVQHLKNKFFTPICQTIHLHMDQVHVHLTFNGTDEMALLLVYK